MSTVSRQTRVRVLGIAQDGGLPHAACQCDQCQAARGDPARASDVSCVAIVVPEKEQVYLIDATPDIATQLSALGDVRRPLAGGVDRAPVDGVFLTHAHMGHYLGLAYFGYEAIACKDLPVWATPRMAGFLRNNAPWDQLVRLGNIALREVIASTAIDVYEGLSLTPISVPHRGEYTDTVGYRIQGTQATVLYIPDTAPWSRVNPPLEELVEGVDVAILDATFYSRAELPGRELSEIGHPLLVDTMDRLQARVDAGVLSVYFTHLNHSNPALNPESEASREIRRRGFHVAQTGQEFFV